MITVTALMLALAYWILGLIFALGGFCALGCVISLFLSVLYSFKLPVRLLAAPLWAVFSFVSLGVCWLTLWVHALLGDNTGHVMQFWFIVGMVVPGILGFGLVPKLIGLANPPNKGVIAPTAVYSAKA
jgi:hypothetical protein